MDGICLELAQALAWVWRHAPTFGGDRRRIVVAGHSAGGHLTAMLMTCQWRKLGADLPDDLCTQGLAISGLFDLAPLVHCDWLQGDLQLTPSVIRRCSPAYLPLAANRLMAAVAGAQESSEFHWHNSLIQQRWGAQAVPVSELISKRNHFDILFDMAQPGSRLHALTMGLLGLGAEV